MNVRRLLAALILTLLVFGYGTAGAGGLPRQVVELLPDTQHVLIVVSSLAEAQREFSAIVNAAGAEDVESDGDLAAMFGDGLPGFPDVVDHDRPLALAIDFSSLMAGGGEPGMAFVFPVDGDISRLDYTGDDSPFTALRQEGDYVALLTDEAMSSGGKDVREPLPGLLSVQWNVEATLAMAAPMLEMGLMGITAAASDTMGSKMTTEEAETLITAINEIVESLDHLDIALQRDGGSYILRKRLAIDPASRLAAGPQPDFADAVALTRLLPGGADMVSAMALDLRRPFEIFKPLYLMNLRSSARVMGEDQAETYMSMVEQNLQMVEWSWVPAAFAVSFSDEKLAFDGVYATPDAEALFDKITGLYDLMATMPLPVNLKPMPARDVGGVPVRSYAITVDTSGGDGSAADLSTAATMQMAEITSLMRRFLPEFHIARVGDHVALTSAADPKHLARFIAACKSPKGKPDKRVVKAAAEAGPETHEVVIGDLGALLRWTFGMISEVAEEEIISPEDLRPLPCEMTVTVGEADYGGALAVERDALLRYIGLVAEIED